MKIVEVFPWNNNFETGIAQIDEQHKRLVDLLNLLASHLAHQSNIVELNSIFDELTNYADYHFKTEEMIWNAFLKDDDWEIQHKETHSQFIDDIIKLKTEENEKSPDNVIEDILLFLTHWLAFHILDNDKRMAKTVIAMQSGLNTEHAKQQADLQMNGAMRILIETILKMYETLSCRTLQLIREITERQKAEAKLRLAANAFDNTLDAICIMDETLCVIDANPAFYQVTDYSETEVLGHDLCLLKTGVMDKKLNNGLLSAMKQVGHWSGIINNRRRCGEFESEWLTISSVKNEQGLVSNYVAVFSNISHLIQQQQLLEKIAHHDALTGLPNRLLLKDRLKLALAHAERTQTFLAVCYLDLDGFKPVNDQFGHAAGDQLLQEIAQRFLTIMRNQDTVARLGGDEFVILIGDLKNTQDYIHLMERILSEINRPFTIQNKIVQVSASIGITLFPADESDADTLLNHADAAMYQAKQTGKSKYCLYTA